MSMDFKEQAGMVAAKAAKDGLLERYRQYGLDDMAVANAIKGGLNASKHVEVLTPKGWDQSPGQPDHKSRLSAANMLADLLDMKAPLKIDLRAQGVISNASRALVEEVLLEQGLIELVPDPDPASAGPVTVPLRPSSFLMEDGFPVRL